MFTIGLTWFCVVLSMVLACHGFVYWFGLFVSCFCLYVCLFFIVLSMVPACFYGFVHGLGFFFFLLIMKGGRKKTRGSHQKTKGNALKHKGQPIVE